MKLTKRQVAIRSYYFAEYVGSFWARNRTYPKWHALRCLFCAAGFMAKSKSV